MTKLAATDTIITAYAESASGPGWGNTPIWFVVRSRLDGKLRQECLQPNEQTDEMHILYGISQCAHAAMTNAVNKKLKGSGRRKAA